MKVVAVVLAALVAGVAHASPQEVMIQCNKDAGEKRLKGDERKEFMRRCIEAGKVAEMAPPSKAAPTSKADKEAHFQMGVTYARLIKRGMKNPDSFQLTDASRTPAGAYCYEYRGTNSFNAIVPSWAVVTPEGKMTAGDQRTVAATWNKHCANKPNMEDLRMIRAAL